MTPSRTTIAVLLGLALLGAGTWSAADPRQGHEAERARGGERHIEPHPGPRGYQRIEEPRGWNVRPPAHFDRGAYQHNFRASRPYRIGPYHRPRGWSGHRWSYGEFLPRAYFAPRYILSDYWLFGLEVPPVGYEWVRYDDDALLVNITTGEILQVVYGAFG